MIQDIAPYHLNNHYDPTAAPDPDSLVLCYHGADVLSDGESFPRVRDFGALPALTYLFTIHTDRFFLLRDETDVTLPQGFTFQNIRTLRENGFGPKRMMYALMTGKHLNDWYAISQYCGRCGSPMHHDSQERAMVCDKCQNRSYPRIMPAVIVGVMNGDSLLLTRYRTGYQHNALIAGFTEIGETAEETVRREVMEEAGLHVSNIRYYKSQPWGIASDLLLGYYCQVEGDATIHMDKEELKYAQWVERKDIELQPDDLSLTNEMMRMFRDGKV